MVSKFNVSVSHSAAFMLSGASRVALNNPLGSTGGSMAYIGAMAHTQDKKYTIAVKRLVRNSLVEEKDRE